MTIPVGILMALCIAGAFIAVTVKNVLHAVFGLAIALLAVGGLFLYLGSPFVAAMEVLIYVGGISVAMVFAVMLSQAISSPDDGEGWVRRVLGGIPAVAFLCMIVPIIIGFEAEPAVEMPAAAWSVEAIGLALLTRYSLVFELLSVVLLLAILGAIAIAQRPKKGEEEIS
jgi:NADH-quinone oxidoreductase subunit J